jgi:hypothetical protein
MHLTTIQRNSGKVKRGQALNAQQVEAPRFQDNRHMKVVRLSALRTGRLYPQEIFLVLSCVVQCLQQLHHHVSPRVR